MPVSFIRLLLDENVDPLLAEILRSRGYDAVATRSMGLSGRTDAELLEWAIREKRAILTHDVTDFSALAAAYAEKRLEHYGIIVSDQVQFRTLLARALRLLGRRGKDEIRNNLEWLQNYR